MASKNKVRVRRKQWEDENMVSVMKAVADKKMTINAAATKFSVPRKILDDLSRVVYNMEIHQGWTLFLQLWRKQGWSRIFSIWQVVVLPPPIPWSRHLPGT